MSLRPSTEWTRGLLDRIGAAGTPLARAVATTIQPGFPMWDELAAMVWLHPEIVRRQAGLFVDFEAGGGAGYGDTLSWTADYRPRLGEQEQTVIQEVDRDALERAILALYARRR